MLMNIRFFLCGLLTLPLMAFAQPGPAYWQQHVDYDIVIDFDVKKHRFKGEQSMVYTNHSPDTLRQLFFHLQLNAFQPGSMMDIRSRTISDPDSRVGDRIAALQDDDIGFTKILSFKHQGIAQQDMTVTGTILQISLTKPIHPGEKTEFFLSYESQVPLQIRRNGRDNKEGIDYSMAQWYPKICAYDVHGWHADEYIGREFYGEFGNFLVNITIDSDYTLAATGELQNPDEVGHGYSAKAAPKKSGKLTWIFKAEQVNDFVWAADRDYKHTIYTLDNGITLRFFYQPGEATEAWEKLPPIMGRVFELAAARIGRYPYPEYAFIQGGDGGMEYPMATLITGNRPLASLVGVSVHELLHCWYPMIMGTNEARYPWMDEGFVSYVSALIMNELYRDKLIPGKVAQPFPQRSDYQGYMNFAKGVWEEPLSTPSDHYQTNAAYGVASYSKGAVFLSQLAYVIGQEAQEAGLLRYYDTWKFKHPTDKDFIRVMEKVSGLQLDWYLDYFVYATHTIDYGIQQMTASGNRNTTVSLQRIGKMPMPVDLTVYLKDGTEQHFHIPLCMMRGDKPMDAGLGTFTVLPSWSWVNPVYEVSLPLKFSAIDRIVLDASNRMADINRDNNTLKAQ
jgi:hypothetical protein